MEQFEIIQQKLEAFIRKYYLNELLKGGILFFTIGVLYFLITLLVEHFLWLNMLGRTLLFWIFILVSIGLFAKFICIPLAKLFKLSKGIDYTAASKMIGKHFPEVKDRLLNVLQLKSDPQQSELLLAGIAQKSAALQPVPFKLAINFKENIKYLKYTAIPILLFLGISLMGSHNWFTESYDRVVNYSTIYEPPAPFHFRILNESLQALENKTYTLVVTTDGDIAPDDISIQFDEELYFMKRNNQGNFEYIFEQPKGNKTFRFKGNEVTSRPYTLDVVAVPVVQNFEMYADYPKYIKKKNEVFKSSGNAVLPEGTKITWKIKTNNTDEMSFITADTTQIFGKDENHFTLHKQIYKDTDYELATSNKKVKNYERLAFGLKVIKDQHPELQLRSEVDSINTAYLYFLGQASDDYGLSKIQLVYYDSADPEDKKVVLLKTSQNLYEEFAYTFPDTLNLVEGKSYDLYFEVYDNDVLHNYKHSRSRVFSYNKMTEEEKKKEQLAQQSKTLGGMDQSLKKFKEQEELLKTLSKSQKEKKELSYNEKKKLQKFVQKQEQQEQMMKNFTKELKENLEKFEENKEEDDAYKEALKDRLERQEKKLKKNEKLLEELKELTDKLDKEELTEKLEELSKQNKNTEKNLEQLVELTKRYYVIKKHEQLSAQLEELSKKQKALSEKDNEENTKEKQETLNKEFEDFQKGMEELRKKNQSLKKRMNLDQNKNEEKSITEEQQNASKKLDENKKQAAKNNQKNAAQKMKQMSDQMQMEMTSMGEQQQEEDAEMLRQILDNLIDYSLSQETLMDRFRLMKENNPDYARSIRRQSVLREHFKHIDDSLYALALRTPDIKEEVTEKITDIELYINKSLEELSENMLLKGASSQRYAITYANELAFMLSQALNNMQSKKSQGKPGKGKKGGESQGFQLPDIIKKQEGLNQQMKEGMEKGKDGKKGKEGEQGNDGESGQKGEKGKKGKDGKSGENGQGNKGGKGSGENKGDQNGKEGKNGKGGQGDKDGKNGSGKNGKGKGKDGEGSEENENPFNSELSNGELYEIFKQQQELRQRLQDKLIKEGISGDGHMLLKRMEQVEQELLNKGFNQGTMQKMQNIKHQLLKLDKAAFQQGEENRREGETNYEEFGAPKMPAVPDAKQYFNRTEILNRQVLPLRQIYKTKVQQYFKKNND